MREHGMKAGLMVLLLTGACAAPVGGSETPVDATDDPLSSDGKADGEPWCDLQQASIQATIHTLEIGINVCHEKGVSTLLPVGESASGSVKHERLRGDAFSVGCTVWNGEVDVDYGMPAEGHLYRIPVTEGQRVFAALDEGTHATLDLLERVYWSESTSALKFAPSGSTVDVVDDGGDAFVHEKDGERFVVVRVRPGQICPNTDHVDYRLSAGDAPPSW